jgi:transcriptional regulator with XRE-family HTH domain
MANFKIIKEIACRQGKSMKEIADAIPMTPQALSKIVRVGSTTTETLERIATILGVHPGVFFDSFGAISSDDIVAKWTTELSAKRKEAATAQAQADRLLSLIELEKGKLADAK